MRPAGIILIIIGVLAAVAGFAAPMVAGKLAIDTVNATDTTTSGQGVLVRKLNTSKLASTPEDPYDTNVPIQSTRQTVADTEAMAQPDAKSAGATVFSTRSLTKQTDTGEELASSQATFAFDPESSELINCCGASLGNSTNVNFSGVMPLKFPFDSPQGDVQLFNTTLLKPQAATFAGTVDAYGMSLYRYTQSIPPQQTPAEPTKVPAALAQGVVGRLAPTLADQVPDTGDLALYEWYSAENEYLVEPLTGQIVDGKVADKTTFRLNGGTQDIVTKVETQASSAEVEEGAAQIKQSADLLALVSSLKLWLLVAAAALVVLGVVLLVLAARRNSRRPAAFAEGG